MSTTPKAATKPQDNVPKLGDPASMSVDQLESIVRDGFPRISLTSTATTFPRRKRPTHD